MTAIGATPTRARDHDTHARAPYHHGHLREALVTAGVDLARAGGPPAVVLREVARRVGVSANAAYRHFDALPALMEAVSLRALQALARSMMAELARAASTGDERTDAVTRLDALGRGYVRFALAEPGLFGAAFDCPPGSVKPLPEAFDDFGPSPYGLLESALRDLADVGILRPASLGAAATNAWATVHGLAQLLLGPMAGLADGDREAVIDATLEFVGRGLADGDGRAPTPPGAEPGARPTPVSPR